MAGVATEQQNTQSAAPEATQESAATKSLRLEKEARDRGDMDEAIRISEEFVRGQQPAEESAVITSEPARQERDAMGAEVDKAEQELQDLQFPSVEQLAADMGIDLKSEEIKLEESGLTSEQEALFDAQQDLNERTTNSLVESIQRQVDQTIRSTEQSQAQARGSSRVQLARMGALNTTSAGVSYMNDLVSSQQSELASIRAQGEELIVQARFAQEAADLETLSQKLVALENNRQAVAQQQQTYLQNVQSLQSILEYQRNTASASIDAMAIAGLTEDDIPDGYLDSLDRSAGYVPGTSAGLLEVSQRAREAQEELDAVARRQAEVTLAQDTINILNSLPVGETITIGGMDYTSLNQGETIDGTEEDGNGNVTLWTYNVDTRETTTKSLGQIGAGAGWTKHMLSDGRIYQENDSTGEIRFVMDPSAPGGGYSNPEALQEDFPDGWKPTNAELRAMGTSQLDSKTGGIQCGQYVRMVTGYGGPSLSEYSAKQALVDPSIGTPENPPQAGDIFIQPGGRWGHIGLVLGSNLLPDGSYDLEITDANSKLDGTIRYRTINSKNVEGFGREGFGLPDEYSFGSDAPEDGILRDLQAAGSEFSDDVVGLAQQVLEKSDYDLNDVPSSMAGEVSAYLNTPQVQQRIQEDNELLAQQVNPTIDDIVALLEHGGLKHAVGFSPLARGAVGRGKIQNEFVGLVEQLISEETLQTLVNAKNSGATFGALSDTELDLIRAAATPIASNQVEKDGKVVAYKMSEEAFERAVSELVISYKKVQGKLTGELVVEEKSTGETWFITPEEFDESIYKLL
jgi:hypothetical protein